MVTAGVYLIGRNAVLYAHAPEVLTIVAIVGTATALWAGAIGLVQNDIKRVLAYSTVSQLGYMFMAMGVGAYTAGIFHLFTHAFFKALLFLGSGAVIHALAGEQDLRRMGGLKKELPITYWTFVIGALAIAGCAIPVRIFQQGRDSVPHVCERPHAVVGRWRRHIAADGVLHVPPRVPGVPRTAPSTTSAHPHDAPSAMAIPLIVLAVRFGVRRLSWCTGCARWVECHRALPRAEPGGSGDRRRARRGARQSQHSNCC